ncbi:MAG: metal-dependent hydrolase [Bacteroidota bacterium]
MDSVTQIVLGAAVGEVVLGKKIGNKAQLFGAIAGTIPDLDVLVTWYLNDPLAEIVIHRSYSHALFVHILLAIPFAWLTHRLFKRQQTFKEWYLLWFLGFATHAILDSFTTYGTQLFMPFTNYMVGFNNISVIDPLYTLPFMFILIYCLFLKRSNPNRFKWAWRSIYISSAYMALTFAVKGYIHSTFSRQMNAANVSYEHLSTSPAILNNALWSGIAYNDSTITFGEYSVFQSDRHIDFITYPRHLELEGEFAGKELETLKWFSQGMYLLEKKDSATLNFYVVKWGRMDLSQRIPDQTFRFYYQLKKDPLQKGNIIMTAVRPDFKEGEFSKALGQLWDRIWEKPKTAY